MSNSNAPNTTPMEVTRASGPFFPAQPTIATSTGTATTAGSATQVATVQSTAPMNPTLGQIWFNASTGQLYCYNGANWQAAQ